MKAPADHEPVIPGETAWLIAVVGLDAIEKPLNEKWVHRAAVYAQLTGLCLEDRVTPESVAAVLCHPKGMMKGALPAAERIVFLNKAEGSIRRSDGQKIVTHLLIALDKEKRMKVLMGSANDPNARIDCLLLPIPAKSNVVS